MNDFIGFIKEKGETNARAKKERRIVIPTVDLQRKKIIQMQDALIIESDLNIGYKLQTYVLKLSECIKERG